MNTCDGQTGLVQPHSHPWKQIRGTSFKKGSMACLLKQTSTKVYLTKPELLQPVTPAFLCFGTRRRKYLHKDELFLHKESNMLDCCMLAFQAYWSPPLVLAPFEDLFATLCMVSSAFFGAHLPM